MGARDKFQRGLRSSRARRASSPWKSSDYRKNKFKRIVLFVFFTPMNVQKASIDHHWSHRRPLFISNFHFCPFFEGATVFRQRRVDSYCLGQVSEIPVGWSMTSRSLGGCTKYKTGVKFFLKTSLMQVNQRCAASSSEEKLHAQLPHLKVDRGQYYEVRIIEAFLRLCDQGDQIGW